jgi:hypothetical protein
LSADGIATNVLLSSAGIMNLVNNTSGADVLTLRMSSTDSYTIESEAGVTVSQGRSISFYNSTNNNLIAQVNFDYA